MEWLDVVPWRLSLQGTGIFCLPIYLAATQQQRNEMQRIALKCAFYGMLLGTAALCFKVPSIASSAQSVSRQWQTAFVLKTVAFNTIYFAWEGFKWGIIAGSAKIAGQMERLEDLI